MADGKSIQKKKVSAGGRVTPKRGAAPAAPTTSDSVPGVPPPATAGGSDSSATTTSGSAASDTRPKLTSATGDKHTGEVKRVRQSGRVTEKGTVGPGGKEKPGASTRYTPPADHTIDMPSPWYIPAIMFALWGIGILLIFLNYVELLPGSQTNWYLLGGLGAILAGIIVATQYK